jgi:hypothetical protein
MTKKLLVTDLPHWPPAPGGPAPRGTIFPLAGEATITNSALVVDEKLVFWGDYAGHQHRFHYRAPNAQIADELYKLVARNVGNSVASLSLQQIEVES